MLAALITLTPGHRNKFIDCQKAKVRITVLPIMDVSTRSNSTLELLESAYRLWEYTQEWLQNPKYSDHRPLFTTHNEWTIIKYVMKVLRPFRYWTLWMSKKHTVTLHHVITVYNNMFDQIDGVMWALAMSKTQWKEELFFAVKLARQKLSIYYAEVTPTTGMLLISADISDPFRKFWSFQKWDMEMHSNPEDETSHTTHYNQACLKHVQNEYCAKHRCVPVNKPAPVPSNNLVPSPMASASRQFSFDPYDLSSNDEEYLTLINSAGTTPGRSDRAACVFTATRL